LEKKSFVTTNKEIDQLILFSKKYKKNARICIHKNLKSKTQIMLNILIKKKDEEFTLHKKTNEFYSILKGKLNIEYFVKNKLKKCVLDKKNNSFFYMEKKILHRTLSLSPYCLFLEIREGIFLPSDTIAKKIDEIKRI